MWLLEQNSFSPSSWFCRPWDVSENKIRSSAHRKWAIISLLIHISWAVDRYVSRSDIYFLNNTVWCFAIRVSQRVDDGALPTTFYNLIEQNMTIYEAKCFDEINKHTTRIDPMHSSLLTRPFKMSMLSEVRHPVRKPRYICRFCQKHHCKKSLWYTIISNIFSIIGRIVIPR